MTTTILNVFPRCYFFVFPDQSVVSFLHVFMPCRDAITCENTAVFCRRKTMYFSWLKICNSTRSTTKETFWSDSESIYEMNAEAAVVANVAKGPNRRATFWQEREGQCITVIYDTKQIIT